MWTLTFLLDLIKLMYEEEEEKYVPFNGVRPCKVQVELQS